MLKLDDHLQGINQDSPQQSGSQGYITLDPFFQNPHLNHAYLQHSNISSLSHATLTLNKTGHPSYSLSKETKQIQ